MNQREIIEIEVEQYIEKRKSRVAYLSMGSAVIAYTIACFISVFFNIEISQNLVLASLTPLVVFAFLRIIYIGHIEHKRVLRFELMDVGIQI